MQKRRLQRARLTEKRAYKMYKKGRLWLVAGLSTFTLETGLVQLQAMADTTSTPVSQVEKTTDHANSSATLTTKVATNTNDTANADTKSSNSSSVHATTNNSSGAATASDDRAKTSVAEHTLSSATDGTKTTDSSTTDLTDSTTSHSSSVATANVSATSAAQTARTVNGTTNSAVSPNKVTASAAATEIESDSVKTKEITKTTGTAKAVSLAVTDTSMSQIKLRSARAAVATVATISSTTKMYDGVAGTPDRYTVTLADGIKAPTDWAVTKDPNVYTDIDLSDFDKNQFGRGIGTYPIAFSEFGLSKLAEANDSLDITAANVVTGTLTIEQAPVHSAAITIGSTSIDYGDSKPSSYQITVTNGYFDKYNTPSTWTLVDSTSSGVIKTTYTIASDSGDIAVPTATEAGTYVLALSAQGLAALQQANPNYEFTADSIVNGQLVIAAHDIITMGATTVLVNKTTSTVQVAVNSRAVSVPGDWEVYYNDKLTDSIVYKVPVSYTTYSTAVDTSTVGKYTITLTDAAMATLAQLNSSTVFNNTNVGDGVVLVKESNAITISPSNYGAKASVNNNVTAASIQNARDKGINLLYGQGLYLVLPLLNVAQSEMTVDNLTEYVIIPAGFKVATTGNGDTVQVATDPVGALTAAIETMMTKNNVTYQGLAVTQLTDYNGRQTFKVHLDQTAAYSNGLFETMVYTLLPTIAVQSSGVTSGLIGNQVSSPDSAVIYVTDDPNENNGSYSLKDQNYPNIDKVAKALGVADAVTISSSFTDYLYTYTLKAAEADDIYMLQAPDGSSLGIIVVSGNVGTTYVPSREL
ncbi:MBG domain-containing protein [Lactiplantibacillus plantarum]|nr:MBG domain-containing protein [Lactiplantibacillus plantarum]MDN3985092.1 MBG domain-containing protein [Lactiplantibacillus plantarum]